MPELSAKAYTAALSWYQDQGVTDVLEDKAFDRTLTKIPEALPKPVKQLESTHVPPIPVAEHKQIIGTAGARVEAVTLAKNAKTLEQLQEAIKNFDGLAIRKTATNMVFCDGNPKARVMLVGEAPGADEDRVGKPFVGVSGQLLDKILACIHLDRHEVDPEKSIYISNILNWRPPGNRTPSPAEVDVSLPFIERHIQLKNPEILILCGGVSAKALLGRNESVSKLRKSWHSYLPLTPELRENAKPVPAITIYHPAYLLRTPSQKRAVWQDILQVEARLKDIK